MSLSTAEAAVVANPDDDAAWQVYADALQAAGDPRGELMAVQRRLAAFPSDAASAARERELLAAHASIWLGADIAALLEPMQLARRTGSPVGIDWRNGFPWRVRVAESGYPSKVRLTLAEIWRRLATVPSVTQFVRSIVFGATSSDSDGDWTGAAMALREAAPPWLRWLTFERDSYWDISMTRIGGLDAGFWRAVPHLEELFIELGEIGLSAIDAPALKRFRVVSSGVNDDTVAELARARWPKLEALSVHLGDPNYGGVGEVAPVEALLQTTPPPALRHLGLCNAAFADELPKALLESKWLPQLTSLDLSDGTLGDEGAEVLTANAAQFAHLQQLNLSRGYFSEAFVDLLRSKLPSVVLNDLQGEAEPAERYLAVSE